MPLEPSPIILFNQIYIFFKEMYFAFYFYECCTCQFYQNVDVPSEYRSISLYYIFKFNHWNHIYCYTVISAVSNRDKRYNSQSRQCSWLMIQIIIRKKIYSTTITTLPLQNHPTAASVTQNILSSVVFLLICVF